MSATLMKCGHTAQGTNAATGTPVCVICVGINPGAEEADEAAPSLEGRVAICSYCKTAVVSSYSLPFFERGYRSKGVLDESKDSYYCGCRGWD